MNKNTYQKPLLTVETLVADESIAFTLIQSENQVFDDE